MAPLDVHQRGKYVYYVALPFPKDVFEVHIAAAILVEKSLLQSFHPLFRTFLTWALVTELISLYVYRPIATTLFSHLSHICLVASVYRTHVWSQWLFVFSVHWKSGKINKGSGGGFKNILCSLELMDQLLQMILRCCQEVFSPSSNTNTQTLTLFFCFYFLWSFCCCCCFWACMHTSWICILFCSLEQEVCWNLQYFC